MTKSTQVNNGELNNSKLKQLWEKDLGAVIHENNNEHEGCTKNRECTHYNKNNGATKRKCGKCGLEFKM